MMQVINKRPDGTFVIQLANGWPYHVTHSDPLFAEAQVEGGNAPLEVPPAPPTPEAQLAAWRATAKVSRFQAREQLRRDGLLTAATAIAQAAGGTAWEAWQSAIEFRRMSDTINGLAPLLRPDLQGEALEEWKDQFFRNAAGIEA